MESATQTAATQTATSYFQQGNLYEKDKAWSKAAQSYRGAIELDPEHGLCHFRLAEVLASQGSWQEALTYYQTAQEKSVSDSNHVGYKIGFALSRLGQNDEAIQAFKQSIENDRNYIWTYYQLALVLDREGRVEDALINYEQVIAISQETLRADTLSQVQNRAGEILIEKGKDRESSASFREAVRLDPSNERAHFNLGLSLLKISAWDEALKHYKLAVELRPENAQAYSELEEALVQAGRLEQSYINTSAQYTFLLDSENEVDDFSSDQRCSSFITITKQKEIKPSAPISIESSSPIPQILKTKMADTHIEPSYRLARIFNAKVFTGRFLSDSNLFHVLDGDKYYADLSNSDSVLFEGCGTSDNGKVDFPVSRRKSKRLEGKGFFFTWSASSVGVHSHWLMQTLPRIDLLRKLNIRPKLMVMGKLKGYQFETLSMLGFSRDDIIYVAPDEVWTVDELYVVHSSATCGVHKGVGQVVPGWQDFYQYLGDQVEDDQVAGRRLYVSRLDVKNHIRRFLNEEQVCEVMREYGFDVIVPSKYTFAEEINVFRNADFIVGPMGAGLYNAVFANEGCRLLAITEDRYFEPWFNHIVSHKSKLFSYLIGESFLSDDSRHKGTHNSWILDITLLRKTLDYFLSM